MKLKINLSKYHYLLMACHSLGDKPMLEKSDLSISFNSKIQNLAQFNAKSTEEIYRIIENSTKTFSKID